MKRSTLIGAAAFITGIGIAAYSAQAADNSIVTTIHGIKYVNVGGSSCSAIAPCCYLVQTYEDFMQGDSKWHAVVATTNDKYYQSYQLFATANVDGYSVRIFPTGTTARCGTLPAFLTPAISPDISFE